MTETERDLLEKHLKISLKEYVDLRFTVAEKEVAEAKMTSSRAVNEAKELMQERLKNTDEKIQNICSEVDTLKGLSKIIEGKASQNAYLLSIFLSLMALGLTIFNIFKK
jgi:hypothetical protein